MISKRTQLAETLYDFYPEFYRYITPVFDREPSDCYDLTALQIQIIMILYYEDEMTPMDLVHVLNIRKGSITALIRSLIMNGYIEKTPLPEDGRSYKLILCDRGREYVVYKKGQIHISLEELFSEMTHSELEAVNDGLQIFTEFLKRKR